MKKLLGSAVCTAGVNCTRCRDMEGGRELRRSLGRFYELPGGVVDFVCPFMPWGVAGGVPAGGPGTELGKLLAWWGIGAEAGCTCKARAALMDRAGVAWCEANIESIADWLEEEAKRRGIVFLRVAAIGLIHLAIRKARRMGD